MGEAIPGPLGRLVPALDFPAETLRLIFEYRDALQRDGYIWAEGMAKFLRERVENHSFLGVLWSGPGDEAVALASWELAGQLGRRGFLYLSEGYQRRQILEEFLHRVESAGPPSLPFLSWADEVPGVSEPDRRAVFSGRGFTRTARADMRLPKRVEPPRPVPTPGFTPRKLSLSDEPLIADMMFRAYTQSPERALFATTLDWREDARLGTHDILHGVIGPWLSAASFGFEEEGRLVAYTLANELYGGLISEVGVDPAYRRHGLAKQLLSQTIDALRAAGFESPRLVVTMWNAGAVRLYRSIGFEFAPGGTGRVWLNLPAFGIVSAPSDAL